MSILPDAVPPIAGDHSVPGWIRTPYGIRLSEDPAEAFRTLKEAENYVIENDLDHASKEVKTDIQTWMSIIEASNIKKQKGVTDTLDELNYSSGVDGMSEQAIGELFYSKVNYMDTRVGGNDAINPYWQFNRDDDIIPPMLNIDNSKYAPKGMGGVYSEAYDAQQQILWMCMGVPEFVNIISFYTSAGDSAASKAMASGSFASLAGRIFSMVFDTALWAITLPVVAPFWAARWISRVDSSRVSRYYYFRPAMTLYYEMVNSMLTYTAVAMGIYPQVLVKRKDSTKYLANKYSTLNSEGQLKTLKDSAMDEFRHLSDMGENINVNDLGIPEMLKDGPDIWRILNRRQKLFNTKRAKYTTRDLIEMQRAGSVHSKASTNQRDLNFHKIDNQPKASDDEYAVIQKALTKTQKALANSKVTRDQRIVLEKRRDAYKKMLATQKSETARVPKNAAKESATSEFWNAFKSTAFGAGDFVGFKVEKGLTVTESVSNQTGQTSIAQKLNDYATRQKEAYESAGNSVWAHAVTQMLTSDADTFMKQTIGKAVLNAASAIGIGDIGAILTNGNGFLDMPEVWKGSTFSKTYSLSMEFESRYGDPVSIMQSVYIPFFMLLCAAMPRSVGNSMYTSPFIIKAYCKGMFSIPAGIIESMSITRGKGEFGWNINRLPTSIKVNLAIKDLTPTFFLSIHDIGFFDTFSRNEQLLSYLDTLSALGITERLYFWPKAMRKLTAAMKIKRNTLFSATYWGSMLGRTSAVRAVAAIAPFANHEKSDMRANGGYLK